MYTKQDAPGRNGARAGGVFTFFSGDKNFAQVRTRTPMSDVLGPKWPVIQHLLMKLLLPTT